MKDMIGLDEGFRGKSPFGHIGDSENYLCVLSDQSAYCHKREVTYNPITAILVLAGVRSKSSPRGGLSNKEMFKA
jgi:hypothetical protein